MESVSLFDIDRTASRSMGKSAKKLIKDLEIHIETDIKKICEQSDIIVTATCKDKNTPPLVKDKWIKEGTHLNAVGGDAPGKIELEKKLLQRSKLVVDFRDQAVYEGESQQVQKNKIHADLAEVVTGIKKGREYDQEITIFDSVGFAMEDLQVYKLLYNMAIELKVGKFLNITSDPKYCKNIYKSYFGV